MRYCPGVLYLTDSRLLHVPYHLTKTAPSTVIRRTTNLLSVPIAALFRTKLKVLPVDSKEGVFRFKIKVKTGAKYYFVGKTPEMANAAVPMSTGALANASFAVMPTDDAPADDPAAPPVNATWQ